MHSSALLSGRSSRESHARGVCCTSRPRERFGAPGVPLARPAVLRMMVCTWCRSFLWSPPRPFASRDQGRDGYQGGGGRRENPKTTIAKPGRPIPPFKNRRRDVRRRRSGSGGTKPASSFPARSSLSVRRKREEDAEKIELSETRNPLRRTEKRGDRRGASALPALPLPSRPQREVLRDIITRTLVPDRQQQPSPHMSPRRRSLRSPGATLYDGTGTLQLRRIGRRAGRDEGRSLPAVGAAVASAFVRARARKPPNVMIVDRDLFSLERERGRFSRWGEGGSLERAAPSVPEPTHLVDRC